MDVVLWGRIEMAGDDTRTGEGEESWFLFIFRVLFFLILYVFYSLELEGGLMG